jgi:flagellar biosynthesis protein FliQ
LARTTSFVVVGPVVVGVVVVGVVVAAVKAVKANGSSGFFRTYRKE